MLTMWWMRTGGGESWRIGFGCLDVARVGDIAKDTVGAGGAWGEVDAGLDKSRKEISKEERKGK
jgi:hypothetical protein